MSAFLSATHGDAGGVLGETDQPGKGVGHAAAGHCIRAQSLLGSQRQVKKQPKANIPGTWPSGEVGGSPATGSACPAAEDSSCSTLF